MRRVSLVLSGTMLLLLCCAPAFAGSSISLSASPGYPVTFTGTGGGNFNVSFNIKNLGATGYGALASSGFYSIVNNGAVVSSAGSCGTGCYMLNQTGPVSFTYGTSAGGSNLLSGNLQLIDIAQTSMGAGVFNDMLVINFTATGGSLQTAFANNNGQLQLTIHFQTNKSLASLLLNKTLLARVVSGAVFPVPEPTSLMLLGGGLLALAGLGKKTRLFA